MKVKSITHEREMYTIVVIYRSGEEKTYHGKLVVSGDIDERLYQHSLLNNLDAKWTAADEYYIILPELDPCDTLDNYIPLGTLRHYVSYHLNSTSVFGLDMLDCENNQQLQFAIFNYAGWL